MRSAVRAPRLHHGSILIVLAVGCRFDPPSASAPADTTDAGVPPPTADPEEDEAGVADVFPSTPTGIDSGAIDVVTPMDQADAGSTCPPAAVLAGWSYCTIREAVEAADPGAVIDVAEGVFDEAV